MSAQHTQKKSKPMKSDNLLKLKEKNFCKKKSLSQIKQLLLITTTNTITNLKISSIKRNYQFLLSTHKNVGKKCSKHS